MWLNNCRKRWGWKNENKFGSGRFLTSRKWSKCVFRTQKSSLFLSPAEKVWGCCFFFATVCLFLPPHSVNALAIWLQSLPLDSSLFKRPSPLKTNGQKISKAGAVLLKPLQMCERPLKIASRVLSRGKETFERALDWFWVRKSFPPLAATLRRPAFIKSSNSPRAGSFACVWSRQGSSIRADVLSRSVSRIGPRCKVFKW